MADPFAMTPERSASYARAAYVLGILLALMAAVLSKTLTYKTGVEVTRGETGWVIHDYTWIRGNGIADWLFVISPVLIAVAFAFTIEVALRRRSRPAAMVALGLAAVSVLGTFYVMFGSGIIYTVPWAMALSGGVVLVLQALEDPE